MAGYTGKQFRRKSEAHVDARKLSAAHRAHNLEEEKKVLRVLERYAKKMKGKARGEREQLLEECKDKVAHIRENKYQLCHKIPNSTLAAATRVSRATQTQIQTLIAFGYSDDNILPSTKNRDHSAMEHLLKGERTSIVYANETWTLSKALNWKGEAIWVALERLYAIDPAAAALVAYVMARQGGYAHIIAECKQSSWTSPKFKQTIAAARATVEKALAADM